MYKSSRFICHNGLASVPVAFTHSSSRACVPVLTEGWLHVYGSSLLVIRHFEQFQQCPDSSEVTLMFQKQSF